MVFALLACDLVVLSGGFVSVLGDGAGAGGGGGGCGGGGVPVAGVFSRSCFCSSGGVFYVPVGAVFWCEHVRVCLCGWRDGCVFVYVGGARV